MIAATDAEIRGRVWRATDVTEKMSRLCAQLMAADRWDQHVKKFSR